MCWSLHAAEVSSYLTITLLGTMLIPKKEGLQAACLNESKCPHMTTTLHEWTLVTLPVQSRVPSRKPHNLPQARTHEKIHPSLQRSAPWSLEVCWSSHLWAGACWCSPGSKHMGTSAHHCAIQTTATSMLLVNPATNIDQRSLKCQIWGLEQGGEGDTARQPFL